MRSCLIFLVLFCSLSAWSNQCSLLFAKQKSTPQMFGLTPSDLSTHHLSQLSLQQNLKALNELSSNRPLDLELYIELLKQDPFSEDIALGAARLAAHGLLNTKLIYQKLHTAQDPVQLENLLEESFKSINSNKKNPSPNNNVVYLKTNPRGNKSSSNSNKNNESNNVLQFGVSFQQVLNAAMTSKLYNSGAIKIHLIQEFINLNTTSSTLNQLRSLSSGQLLVYKASYSLSNSEVLSLKNALNAGNSLDIASFVFLTHRASSQLFSHEAFLKLIHKKILIKAPSLNDIMKVSEKVHKKEIQLVELIEFLSLKAKVNQMSQKPILSLLQVAKILELKNRNHIEDSIIERVFDHNIYLGDLKVGLKELLFQRKLKSGFKVYDLRDDRLLASKLYSLLSPEVVINLALNQHIYLNKFVNSFQHELKRLIPSRLKLLAKRYISKPKSETWELELYNTIIDEAFSKAEQSL